MKFFEQWRCARNEVVLKQSYSAEPQIYENIEEMSEEQLDFVLAWFVSEVKREDGNDVSWKDIIRNDM